MLPPPDTVERRGADRQVEDIDWLSAERGASPPRAGSENSCGGRREAPARPSLPPVSADDRCHSELVPLIG